MTFLPICQHRSTIPVDLGEKGRRTTKCLRCGVRFLKIPKAAPMEPRVRYGR